MIQTIDCQYVRPEFAAAYLVVEDKQALLVENNTSHSVPLILDQLKKAGLTPEQVQYLIVTHVHLDHAGGSSALMKLCPNATLLAHPRAARHLIDPSKLIAGAQAVYGKETFEELYGKIDPIDSSRVREMKDEEVLTFGSLQLRFFYTLGHAKHHFCISTGDGVFTGDSFGLAYPYLQKKGLWIFPSTSPTDFDPDEARKSLQKIRDTGAKKAYLTHFGEITDLATAQSQLLEYFDRVEEILQTAQQQEIAPNQLTAFCEKALHKKFQKKLEARGMAGDSLAWEYLKLDLQLNAQGMAWYAGIKA